MNVWVNGKLLDANKPAVSALDRGFLHGDGVYETLRVTKGQPFHFHGHFNRLRQSARGLGIKIPKRKEEVLRAIHRLLKANRLKEAALRITLSRGVGPRGFDPRPCKTPTFTITTAPLPKASPGLTLAVVSVRRPPPSVLDPALKTTNNLNNILAVREALRRGAREALLLNIDGYLAEGSASNLFFISGTRLKTPSLDCGILAGVTRKIVLQLAHREGLSIQEGCFRPRDLYGAQEVFMTSTLVGVLPVVKIVEEGGRRLTFSPGSWTDRLRRRYRDLLNQP
jgi:branched-chain amino acid aminotransferase